MSEADWIVDRMSNPDIHRDVRRHLERHVAEPVKPKVTRKRTPKAPPAELTPEAKAICDVMGWEYDTSTKIAEGNVASSIVRDLEAAGWRLYPVPGGFMEK